MQYSQDRQKVICYGGDGALNEVITGLIKSNLSIPLGYIPTGTTNDLAHTLNLPTNHVSAIDLTTNGHVGNTE